MDVKKSGHPNECPDKCNYLNIIALSNAAKLVWQTSDPTTTTISYIHT